MGDSFVKRLMAAEDPEKIKKLIKKLDSDTHDAIIAVFVLAESELLKIHGIAKTDPNNLSEANILNFRKCLIALQLFARQMIGLETMATNIERTILNLILPLVNFCGPYITQSMVTLKIDALSMYGKLLQAFEDLVIPYSEGILNFILEQLDLHSKIFKGDVSLDPFEAMIIRELYSEFISQSVDVCCTMVLISPEELARKALPLFERSCAALSIVKDINCKYELVELIAQMCLLALKNPEEQTEEEDFLDFETRKTQVLENPVDEPSTSNTLSTLDFTTPLWNAKDLKFEQIRSTLEQCIELFNSEEYENDDMDYEDGENNDDDDNDDEEGQQEGDELSTESSQASFEAPSPSKDTPKKTQESSDHDQKEVNKRKQEEAGTGTVIALLSGLSHRYFTESQHAICFKMVYDALLDKISAAFSNAAGYSKMPAMLDAMGQLLSNASPQLVASQYANLTALLEQIMKTIRIWKSENPSPKSRRVYDAIRAELISAYSALLRQDPVSTLDQSEHFMTAVTFLLADPTIMADFAVAIASLANSSQNKPSSTSPTASPSSSSDSLATSNGVRKKKADAAIEKLKGGGLLFKIGETYLKELANPDVSVSMKKVVMQSIGKLSIGSGALFAPLLEITVPVLLYLGRDVPDLAPTAITAVAQIMFGLRKEASVITPFLLKAVDQAIAMVLQDVLMSGMEISEEAIKASDAASEIKFNFSSKSRMKEEEEEDSEEEDEYGEMMQDDNVADLVYKGECFLSFVLHTPELLSILTSHKNGSIMDGIFTTLLELEEKPTLFEEDTMLKMTAVDIILFMVKSITQTHTKAHQGRALNALRGADVDNFEEELQLSIRRLEAIQF